MSLEDEIARQDRALSEEARQRDEARRQISALIEEFLGVMSSLGQPGIKVWQIVGPTEWETDPELPAEVSGWLIGEQRSSLPWSETIVTTCGLVLRYAVSQSDGEYSQTMSWATEERVHRAGVEVLGAGRGHALQGVMVDDLRSALATTVRRYR
jgi:hypothetical protein